MEDKQKPIEEDDEKNELVEYNLSAIKIGLIGKYLAESDYYFQKHKLSLAFPELKCIYIHIYTCLSKQQDKIFNKLEIGFLTNQPIMLDPSGINGFVTETKEFKAEARKRRANQYNYYIKYAKFIQKMLRKYGYDMKMKESTEYEV